MYPPVLAHPLLSRSFLRWQRVCLFLVVLPMLVLSCRTAFPGVDTKKPAFSVIAYYNGRTTDIDKYRIDQLTHLIYSFLHLRGGKLTVDDAGDSLTIRKLVALKQGNPNLKVMLALGGWSGCKPCSEVFSTAEGRRAFAWSTKKILLEYEADGIDLDWEYPAIEGFPGHPYQPADREHFTALVQELRYVLGSEYEISFAAGGFKTFFDKSIDWQTVMPLLDRVNLMSYDLVGGYSTETGHHTPLYSTDTQLRSVDHGVRYLDSLGVPKKKIVIGAAFYARIWGDVPSRNRGLYQPGVFKRSLSYRKFETVFTPENGFVFYRDSVAKAPFAYSEKLGQFATFDDVRSIARKTEYARQQGLGGIMFWQLGGDKYANGLLQSIEDAGH